jgi:hypothetical protein
MISPELVSILSLLLITLLLAGLTLLPVEIVVTESYDEEEIDVPIAVHHRAMKNAPNANNGAAITSTT